MQARGCTAAGAVASALLRGTFGWQAPVTRYIPNYLVGGAMMGVKWLERRT